MPRWSLPALAACAAVAVIHVGLQGSAPATDSPPHHVQGGFRNLDPRSFYPLLLRARHVFRGAPPRGPQPFVVANDGVELRANGHHPTVTWVGHATLLIQIDGVNVLTDPHFGERTSPLSFVGPRRLVPPGIAFADLPPIDAVVISHDHYDHLDLETVRRLAREHRPTFFVPLGLKAWLASNGVDRAVELDWWESHRLGDLTITCTPAQHSSGRGLHDQDSRLWASWMVVGRERRAFFAGDTGYTPFLGEIARRLGPPDVAVLPIGGYSDYPEHHPNHLNPEEAVRLFEDLRARLLVPMHWGTFDLNREPFREPPTRLRAEARRRGIEEQVAVLSPGQTIPW
jgi:N-acyl-phosphatidylethanolamine-hydrolysing phospholipase D